MERLRRRMVLLDHRNLEKPGEFSGSPGSGRVQRNQKCYFGMGLASQIEAQPTVKSEDEGANPPESCNDQRISCLMHRWMHASGVSSRLLWKNVESYESRGWEPKQDASRGHS